MPAWLCPEVLLTKRRMPVESAIPLFAKQLCMLRAAAFAIERSAVAEIPMDIRHPCISRTAMRQCSLHQNLRCLIDCMSREVRNMRMKLQCVPGRTPCSQLPGYVTQLPTVGRILHPRCARFRSSGRCSRTRVGPHSWLACRNMIELATCTDLWNVKVQARRFRIYTPWSKISAGRPQSGLSQRKAVSLQPV